MQKNKIYLKRTNDPSVVSTYHMGRYIGKFNKVDGVSFIVETKELIRKCGGGFGVLPEIANCKKIDFIIFIFQSKKYTISRKRFLQVGKNYHLGEIEKICVPISYFNCEDDASEPTLFDNTETVGKL